MYDGYFSRPSANKGINLTAIKTDMDAAFIMISKTILCVLVLTFVCLLCTTYAAPAPERPNRFDTVDEYLRYLTQVNSHYGGKRNGRPQRPEQFETISEYLKYLTDLNSFLSSNEKRSTD
ncbi:hypothetical protein LSH36_690g01016 [Paralvinella palmiformis]|uniref:Uncharacterized protein n=1 Tax=Paralvinella palmiformis TaxID=53620 RepID=A0AAD9J250_9ANNE|nr:hypothetical protein LSH36_690g01016 [Paralvinella palmiformis]